MSDKEFPIAIVGYAYRAPGVSADETLFDYLAQAKSAWGKVPSDRFDQDAYYDANKEKAGTFAVKGAHFLKEDVFRFDAPFFNLRAEEARAIDPQHRMLLECAFEAVDHAGLRLHDLAGSETGVFSAVASGDYGQQMADDPLSASNWTATGTAPTMFANRLSYFFDLIGPSVSLDTACASSGYAVHLACQSLRLGECKTALVGGASLLLGPYQFTILDTMGALSPEGRCYSYDHKAAGFGRGEGAACMMLKPLDQAIADGDPIQAVIRNTTSNHSGRSDGITMPSGAAQVRLLRKVHDQIGLNPSETPVIEGHGTGTLVGDRIELGAFAKVLAAERTPSDPLYVGSLKSNFGHLEGASGILALTKTVLMVQHGIVLPNADFEKLGPVVDGIEKLRVLSSPAPWPAGAPRRVCMTNFGFGGSNAAVLVESHQQPVTNGHANGLTNGHVNGLANGHAGNHERLFVLSAHSQSSLVSHTQSIVNYLELHTSLPDNFLQDLSFTLGQRRTQHAWRLAATASSTEDLSEALSKASNTATRARHPSLAWAFTGQGVQYAQMTLELWQSPEFSSTIDEADIHLTAFGASWSLKEELRKPEADSRIDNAELSQPACTAVQLGLIAVLRSWGLSPCAVTGHSSGEIAAAYAAGFLNMETAMAIAYFRGQAAASLEAMGSSKPKGGMLALGISAEDASALLAQNSEGYATIAAINSPRAVTLSGDEKAIENLHRLAESQGLFARRLRVGLAYHSAHMEAVADSYHALIERYCKKVTLSKSDAGPVFISSLLGKAVDVKQVNASYWVQNLLQPVRFLDAIEGVLDVFEAGERAARRKGAQIILEVGPHSGLKTPIQQTISDRHQAQKQTDMTPSSASYMSTLVRGTASDHSLLELAGKLFVQGFLVELGAVNHTSHKNAKVLTYLPRYAWDRSARYIHQSRIANAKLHPGFPYDPLIGAKAPSADGQEHIFRQIFTLDEMPWIREHAVNGRNVFPMTGYIAMAIAAARMVAAKAPVSLTLKDIHTKRSLEIAEDERLEMTTKLIPLETGTESFSSTAWSFKVSSWSEKRGWVTHCYGQIEPEMREISIDTPTFQTASKSKASQRREELDPDVEYGGRSGVGTLYGDAYRVMQRFWKGDGWTEMESRLRDAEWSLQSESFGSPVTVDPPSLDAHLQGMAPFLSANIEERPAVVPTYVSRLRVSNDIPATGGDEPRFNIITQCLSKDTRAGTTKVGVAVFARSQQDGPEEPLLVPVAEWESVTFRSLSSSEDDPAVQNRAEGIPNSFYWDLIPSLDFIDNASLAVFQGGDVYEDREVEERRQLNSASLHYMQLAIDAFPTPEDRSMLSVHSSGFLTWAAGAVKRYASANTHMTAEQLKDVARTSARGELVCNIGEQLVPILRGDVQPLEIMLRDNLLWRQYEEDTPSIRLGRVIGRYARSLLNIRGSLRVLEIGAGTGSATLPLLEAFSDGDEGAAEERRSLLSYTYTDISSGFFDTARSKMQHWASSITYKKLDIGQDPLEQGFEAGDYDMIVAANVLHATADMSLTMHNVRKLLKGNGKLVLLEALAHAPLTLPFALLPGWWLAEDDYRDKKIGPLMDPQAWDRLLTDSGFSGVDGTVPDFPEHTDQLLGLMCSTRVGKVDDDSDMPIAICGAIRDDDEEQFASIVAEQVTDRLNCPTSVKPLAEVDPEDDDAVCILIDSPGRSILQQDEMTAEAYETLRYTLLTTKALLWVIPEDHTPEHEVIRGILRSLRLEDVSGRILLLEGAPRTEQGAALIAQLAERLRDPELSRDLDQDFVYRDGQLHVARLRHLASADEAFAAAEGKAIRRVQAIWREDTAMELTVDAAGSPDFIYFRSKADVLETSMGENEILIRNESVGVNFRDLLVVLGSIPWTPPGFEGVGTIIKTGQGVSNLQIGDRVCYGSLTGGSYSTMLRIPAWHAFKIPDHLSIEQAAGISTPYSTAVMALIQIGRLRKGETVLIHAASGGVGQACIVLAQHIGARVFATAGSPAKRTFLQETFNLPDSQIFSSRTSDFRDSILHATDGEGVDVIVNSLSGKLLHDTWALIAESGRFVEIGKKDILANSHLAMRHFEKNVTFSGVDLRLLFEKRPEEMKDCLAKVVELLDQNVVVPIRPQTVLPISQLAAGLRKLQSGQNIGKIVITISPDDRVLAETPPPKPSNEALLKRDATYLITGGSGGIGRSLAPWMFQNGAGSVVLLGRSGSSNPEVSKLLQRYESDPEVKLRAVACDVSSRESLVNALGEIKDLAPVRGVVHGALSIRDAFFSNSSYDDWQNTTGPKIPAAWYLHEMLPDLNFFVSLGSFLGACGNAGQTIYSGTSSFLDAFTAYRNSLGLPSVSIALPIVLGVGYVADRAREDEMTTRVGMTLTEGQVHTAIRGAIVGPSSGLNHNGVTSSFNLPPGVTLKGHWFHPRNLMRQILDAQVGKKPAENGLVNGEENDSGAPLGMLDALIQKVSSMTMIDMKEMEADAPLETYGLDSLVSVELRNWIRRETGVELSLAEIGAGESLAALAATISSMKKK